MTTIKQFFGSDSWRRLRELKLPNESEVGGVCEALGKATPLAPWMWRVLFSVAVVAWGSGALAYFILWTCIPDEEKA